MAVVIHGLGTPTKTFSKEDTASFEQQPGHDDVRERIHVPERG
jgi:hypothetical protein